MTLMTSALGLVLSLILSIGLSVLDKTRGEDKYRVVIAVAGIMAMLCTFYLLINLLVYYGVLG